MTAKREAAAEELFWKLDALSEINGEHSEEGTRMIAAALEAAYRDGIEDAAKVIEMQRYYSDFHMGMGNADVMLARKVRVLASKEKP